jgi:RHS repeat-associated protein
MRHFLLIGFAAVALSARANVYITPVATARVGGRVYVTATVLKNSGSEGVKCKFVYTAANHPDDGALHGQYELAPGRVLLDEATLVRTGAVGTIRFDCSGPLTIAASIRSSIDGGKTFDSGRTYRSAGAENPVRATESRSIRTSNDLLLMELAGKPARMRVVAKDRDGKVLGHDTYQIPAFGEQVVNLSLVRAKCSSPVVELSVTGEGALAVTTQSDDDSLTALFKPDTPGRLLAAETSGAKAIQMLGLSPFKAAPFVEPMTGHIYLRRRWYDPHTGTFLAPDPAGYRDSANLYSYCGGDPVNCSDPTGLAASAGLSGWIVATDNRHGGRTRRFSPAEIAADPQKVRAFLGTHADVDAREADAIIGRAGASWATGADKMRIVAPGAAKAAGVYPLMAATAGAGLGSGAGVVASGELGLGFVGSTMLPGFTGGMGEQAGRDIGARSFSGVRQYAVSGSVGAVGSLAFSALFVGAQRILGFGASNIFPSIAPEGGWRSSLAVPVDIAATFENGKFTARVLTEDLIVYRAEGQAFGRWFGAVRADSAAKAEHLYNMSGYGNDLTTVATYRIPARTIVWEGRVAGGSGWQYYVPNPRAAGVIQIGGPRPLPQFGF